MATPSQVHCICVWLSKSIAAHTNPYPQVFLNVIVFPHALFPAAGKSFTMSGFGEYLGVNYRALLKLFEILDLRQKTAVPKGAEPGTPSPFSFTVELSVLSMCREQVFDLLSGEHSFDVPAVYLLR
jgi:hypothetical protein